MLHTVLAKMMLIHSAFLFSFLCLALGTNSKSEKVSTVSKLSTGTEIYSHAEKILKEIYPQKKILLPTEPEDFIEFNPKKYQFSAVNQLLKNFNFIKNKLGFKNNNQNNLYNYNINKEYHLNLTSNIPFQSSNKFNINELHNLQKNLFDDPTFESEFPIIFSSDSVSTKRNKALRLLQFASVKKDNSDATYLLAESFLHGYFNLPRNLTFSFQNYQLLAQTSNSTGQRMTGLLYATGLGTKRDYAKGLLYLSFASISGDIIATQALGYYNLVGIAVNKNCEDAAFHYSRVAKAALENFNSGPPLGLTLPATKLRLTDENGGVFGHGASGPGDPLILHSTVNENGALSNQDILLQYEFLADKDEVEYQWLYGLQLYQGSADLKRDYGRAFYYFRRAADQYPKDPATIAALKTNKNSKLPLRVIRKAECSAEAVSYVGLMYWRGEGVKKADPETARTYFEKGVEWGSAISMNALGLMYRDGIAGLPKDPAKAIQYFVDGANKKNSEAQANLGEYFYQKGKADHAQAMKYFGLASKTGNLLALYRLGEMHTNGLGANKKSCLIGVGYYKNLVERADWHMPWHHRAQELYNEGDFEGAYIAFSLAAELGYEVSQTNAAWMIDSVEHTESLLSTESYRSALNFWNRAANQGNVDARVKMGDYHYYGYGINQEEDESQENFENDESNPAAKKENDFKTKNDKLENKITSNDISFAQKLFNFFGFNYFKKNEVCDYEKAALYYQVAAESEHSAIAFFNLGYMHEHGLGVEEDYHLAKRCYDLSLTTNPGAYLPVKLAIMKLNFKFFWKGLFSGKGLFQLYSEESLDEVHNFPPLEKEEDSVDEKSDDKHYKKSGVENVKSELDFEDKLLTILLTLALAIGVWRMFGIDWIRTVRQRGNQQINQNLNNNIIPRQQENQQHPSEFQPLINSFEPSTTDSDQRTDLEMENNSTSLSSSDAATAPTHPLDKDNKTDSSELD
ncbi:ERAD-associated protein [Lobulomyces angularis]|nr:ERAD-associated protein [Lobulomyces angularis]